MSWRERAKKRKKRAQVPPAPPASPRRPTALDAEIGKRIVLARLARGLDQLELARAMGLTGQQMLKYEKGTNRVAAGRLYCIATFLRVPIGFFFLALPEPQSASDLPHGERARAFDRLLSEIVDPQARLRLLEMLDTSDAGPDEVPA